MHARRGDRPADSVGAAMLRNGRRLIGKRAGGGHFWIYDLPQSRIAAADDGVVSRIPGEVTCLSRIIFEIEQLGLVANIVVIFPAP